MTSLPSFRAMLEGDEHSTLQATAFTFPTSSAFLMSPHLTSFPPLVKQSLPQCSTFMNAPMFPIISGVQNGINSSHSHIQTGFFSEGDKKYCLPDRALQKRMDVATPTTKETFEINVPQDNEVMALSKSSQGTQQSQPQRSLLQEQQKEVRERMEYLSTLLNSASTPDGRTEVPRRSRELSVATDEDDVSPEGIFDHYIEQLPAKKRQRVDPSSKQAAEKRFRTYQAEQWNEKFDDLVRFKNKFRHCCVPHTYPEDPTLVGQLKICVR